MIDIKRKTLLQDKQLSLAADQFLIYFYVFQAYNKFFQVTFGSFHAEPRIPVFLFYILYLVAYMGILHPAHLYTRNTSPLEWFLGFLCGSSDLNRQFHII